MNSLDWRKKSWYENVEIAIAFDYKKGQGLLINNYVPISHLLFVFFISYYL